MDAGTTNVEQLAEKMRMDFYKLHYPTRKSPKSKNKTNHKLRSNSVISVSQYKQQEQQKYDQITPKGSVRRNVLEKKHYSPYKNYDANQFKGKDKLSFHAALGPKTGCRKIEERPLPVNSMKDVEDLSKNNLNVRLAIQRNKDEKVKMNRILLSHKQNEEIKLEYLRNKKQEIQETIAMDMKALYEQFFKKEYEELYGKNAQEKFEQKFDFLLMELSKRVFHQ